MTAISRSSSSSPAIYWLRRDFRLHDNPALLSATREYGAVIPVFIWSPDAGSYATPGAAARWWLHYSLESLRSRLESMGSSLIIRRGDWAQELMNLVRETGASSVYFNRLYEPEARTRDLEIEEKLQLLQVETRTFNASLLLEPWEVSNRSGNPFQVFTPFWRQCLEQLSQEKPVPAPRSVPPPKAWPPTLRVDDLNLLPKYDWATGLRNAWRPGEAGAIKRLKKFASNMVGVYARERDALGQDGTSRLSPHLHFGEIGPRQILHAVRNHGKAAEAFVRELGWREFAYHILHHFPKTPFHPLRPAFESFPWAEDPDNLRAWQQGMTGYPLVDAGMRELWETGWMHNRARMAVASFLVKHLLIPWQSGAAWFWDTLVDADLANNTLGWQWTAGCGADAAPYFRIFNPVLQGQRYAPDGSYVRHWLPELAKMPAKWIHSPWDAAPLVLEEAGVRLGKTYPFPIVEHEQARDRALEAFSSIKR